MFSPTTSAAQLGIHPATGRRSFKRNRPPAYPEHSSKEQQWRIARLRAAMKAEDSQFVPYTFARMAFLICLILASSRL